MQILVVGSETNMCNATECIIAVRSLQGQPRSLLCAQANSASYPQRDGKWVVAHGLRGEGLVRWLGRWYVCVLHRGSNCSPSRAMDGRIMRHGIVSWCQSAATSEIVKRCCSSLVSSAITSTQTFYLLLIGVQTTGVTLVPWIMTIGITKARGGGSLAFASTTLPNTLHCCRKCSPWNDDTTL